MYFSYSPALLKKMQDKSLELLKAFIKLCNDNEINYLIDGGTLLGAVRHNGFIPWDDDIDVVMLRTDYIKLMNVCGDALKGTRYRIRSPYAEKDCLFPSTTFYECGTRLIRNDMKPFKGVMMKDDRVGFHIDIFVLDNVPESEKLRKRQMTQAYFAQKLFWLSLTPFPDLMFRGIAFRLARAIFFISHYVMNAIGFNHQRMLRMFNKISLKYHGQSQLFRIMTTSSIKNITVFTKDDIFPLSSLKFEGIEVTTYHNYEKYLCGYYGNYMQLPPPEKRKNHPPYYVDFGDSIFDAETGKFTNKTTGEEIL